MAIRAYAHITSVNGLDSSTNPTKLGVNFEVQAVAMSGNFGHTSGTVLVDPTTTSRLALDALIRDKASSELARNEGLTILASEIRVVTYLSVFTELA